MATEVQWIVTLAYPIGMLVLEQILIAGVRLGPKITLDVIEEMLDVENAKEVVRNIYTNIALVSRKAFRLVIFLLQAIARLVGWGIAGAVAMHHLHDPLRSRRVESAAAMERCARAGTAKEKKGTNNPGSALLALMTLDTWPTSVGQPCAGPTAVVGPLGCVWLTRPPCPVVRI